MKEFDYVIIGGGCAGLSLAHELELHNKLSDKTLAIIEPREEYKRDKTWSFWRTFDHNFNDCVIKNWNNFTINTASNSHKLRSEKFPYQSIDSGLFYRKINNKLSLNKNIRFYKNINEINISNAFIFNSVPETSANKSKLWQHFQGVEIETKENFFDDEIINLMDFNCDQRNDVHFFYTLPFSKNRALIETTWLSNLNDSSLADYNSQVKKYIEFNLGIKDYIIKYKEEGAIPLFYLQNKRERKKINIGAAGGMTRLSTGYTFLNIQEHCKYIREKIGYIEKSKIYSIGNKYKFLDKIFLKVLKKYPEKMPNIFFKMFKCSANTIIKFLSNKSNIFEDLLIISKMPKWIFIKALFRKT